MSKESEFLLKNQLVMAESIIESIQTILDGEEVSDFALSFGIVREVAELKSQLSRDWFCLCGHWNGCNLNVCALCGRTPGESLPR
jgi:hypothetical protein